MKERTPETALDVQYESSPDLERMDFMVTSDPDVQIGVRSVRDPDRNDFSVPILLVHGARVSSIPSFDLDIPGGSLAADLAAEGHQVFLMDARNYGSSTRELALRKPPEGAPPLTRSEQAVADISAVVEHIRQVLSVDKVAALGWATGAQWLAHYASEYPDTVSHLVLFNAIWPEAGEWPIGDALEDTARPGQLKADALPAYGFATGDALLARWNDSIPVPNPDGWRDPAIAGAYVQTAISGDPSSLERNPPSIRTPLGAMADSFLLSKGHRLFTPDKITAHVLVVRSELDFWSRPIDVDAAQRELTSAASVQYVELRGATHFAHLDRAEHGRADLINAILRSVRQQSPG